VILLRLAEQPKGTRNVTKGILLSALVRERRSGLNCLLASRTLESSRIGSTPMKTNDRTRLVRCTRWLPWVASLYAAMLMTLAVDATARTADARTADEYASINAERARIRRIGNIVGLSLMGALLSIPVVLVLRHAKNAKIDLEFEHADAE
jgi:hypothetical protein